MATQMADPVDSLSPLTCFPRTWKRSCVSINTHSCLIYSKLPLCLWQSQRTLLWLFPKPPVALAEASLTSDCFPAVAMAESTLTLLIGSQTPCGFGRVITDSSDWFQAPPLAMEESTLTLPISLQTHCGYGRVNTCSSCWVTKLLSPQLHPMTHPRGRQTDPAQWLMCWCFL